MKRFVRYSTLMAVALLCGAGAARAQSPAPIDPDRGYAEVNVGATFGHTGDASVGGEFGWKLHDINSPLFDEMHVFAEAGDMMNVATSDVNARALLIANAIGATTSVKQEATYFDAGLRFRLMPLAHGKWRSYILVGVGAARVKTTTNFAISGNDVTSRLDQFGVQLGDDLASSITKPLFTIGGGSSAKFGKRLVVDISYRYGRIFPKPSDIVDDVGINTSRLQGGVGIRF